MKKRRFTEQQVLILLCAFDMPPIVLVGHVGVAQTAFALGLLDESGARTALPCLSDVIRPCATRRNQQYQSCSTDEANQAQHPRFPRTGGYFTDPKRRKK